MKKSIIIIGVVLIMIVSFVIAVNQKKCSIYQTFCFDSCNDLQKNKFRNATLWLINIVSNITENRTNLIFEEVNKECNILVNCSLDRIENNTTAGTIRIRSLKEIGLFNKNDTIYLLYYTKICSDSNSVEKHELLHTFGLNHSFEEDDLMYKDTPCRGMNLTKETVEDIRNNFSCFSYFLF